MADRDEVDQGTPVERWVLIGHSLHQHFLVRADPANVGPDWVRQYWAACGYSCAPGFEVIPDGDCGLPRCPRCLDELADMAGSTGDRR